MFLRNTQGLTVSGTRYQAVQYREQLKINLGQIKLRVYNLFKTIDSYKKATLKWQKYFSESDWLCRSGGEIDGSDHDNTPATSTSSLEAQFYVGHRHYHEWGMYTTTIVIPMIIKIEK